MISYRLTIHSKSILILFRTLWISNESTYWFGWGEMNLKKQWNNKTFFWRQKKLRLLFRAKINSNDKCSSDTKWTLIPNDLARTSKLILSQIYKLCLVVKEMILILTKQSCFLSCFISDLLRSFPSCSSSLPYIDSAPLSTLCAAPPSPPRRLPPWRRSFFTL